MIKGGVMKIQNYIYIKDGFGAVLYDADNGDDRLLIVIQGLKGLELPSKYAEMFAGKGYSALAMSYYGSEGQQKTMRAIPLEQFRKACDKMKLYENGRFKRFGIYGNSKGAGMALLAASVVPDISLVIAASSFAHIMQGSGGKDLSPCKAMVSLDGSDFPYVSNKGVFGAFVRRCLKEHNVRLLYFFDEWEKKGSAENEIPVEKISGDILLLTSTNDESVPAKRGAEQLISRLKRTGFAYSYRHINFENGSHNLGYFPINNNLLPQEKKHPEDCRKAREDALEIILQTLGKWGVEDSVRSSEDSTLRL